MNIIVGEEKIVIREKMRKVTIKEEKSSRRSIPVLQCQQSKRAQTNFFSLNLTGMN